MAGGHRPEAPLPGTRYGTLLFAYYRRWYEDADGSSNFFYWLDSGRGKTLSFTQEEEDASPKYRATREKLERCQVAYFDAHQRRQYEVAVDASGRLHYRHGNPDADPERLVDPDDGQCYLQVMAGYEVYKGFVGWMVFVMAHDGTLYACVKKTGCQHHSSLLAGAPVMCAGSLIADNGLLKGLMPISGHYMPTRADFVRCETKLREMGTKWSDDVKLADEKLWKMVDQYQVTVIQKELTLPGF